MPKEERKKADGTSASEKKTAKAAKKKTKTAKKKTKKTTTTKSTKKAVAAKKTKAKKAVAAKKTKAKKATAKTTEKRLRIHQMRSGIHHPHRMRRTLTALGLKHHQDEVVVPDNASIRGMLKQVHHLVSVMPEETNG